MITILSYATEIMIEKGKLVILHSNKTLSFNRFFFSEFQGKPETE